MPNTQGPLEKIRQDLQATQEQYEQTKRELDDLERELERLRNAYEVLQEYLGDGPLADESLSIADAARIVLRETGTPLSVANIAEIMLERGFPYSKGSEKLRRSLAGTLSRDENDFERVERGVYRLKNEASHDRVQDVSAVAENNENDETPTAD